MQVEVARVYRVEEVAAGLGVSAAAVYRAIESGRLAALRGGSGSGAVWVSGAAVLEYLRASCARPAAVGQPGWCGASFGRRVLRVLLGLVVLGLAEAGGLVLVQTRLGVLVAACALVVCFGVFLRLRRRVGDGGSGRGGSGADV